MVTCPELPVRSLLVGLILAACGGITPPEFGRLTGSWHGGCCLGPGLIIDGGVAWSMDLTEDSSGNVSGTVTESESLGPSTHPALTKGTVTGEHEGSDVVLSFRFDDGRRRLFRGQQISETGMEGSMSGYRGEVVGFAR